MRHKALVIIWVAVLGIGGYTAYSLFLKPSGSENPYVLSNNSNQKDTPQQADEPKSSEPKRVGMNEAARDGDLEFTVTGINTCTERTVGTNQYAMDEAEGQFCRLSIKVKNVGSSPVSLPTVQRISKGNGDEYKLDPQATQYAQENQSVGLWYENIAPGATVSGDLLFDVNGGPDIKFAYLHAAEGSPGVAVKLQ